MSHHLAALMKHKLAALVIAASTGCGAVAFVAAGSAAPPPPLSLGLAGAPPALPDRRAESSPNTESSEI